ncbi:type II toxin-antitoxin system VapC family toxin [Indioceanicola profundi]|uniref:type II toxin-antitoxin system VapC family toxin n=1 Tax=Indioceanicola profundi TaxID=2220096 RepID=UPI000E6A9C11|nr:type II toxin-antitoxin system VapC family toxin [Indioceanicola profundi]
MTAVLLDTHAWVWSLRDDVRLSQAARTAIENARRVLVSPISFFEIGQKARLGKWPEMEPFAAQLPSILDRQGGAATPLDPAICLEASLMDWSHRDPFDRLIAATALHLRVPLISADAVFDEIAQRVW